MASNPRPMYCTQTHRRPHSDGTPATQINRIVSHPTMSVLVTAHEDKFIRIFDLTTGMFPPYSTVEPLT